MSRLAILGGDPVRRTPFSRWPQFLTYDAERLQKVLESGHWGGFPVPSHYAGEFAEKFAELHGACYGICIANGTIALIAALQAAGIRFGDEVIVPAYTWDGTATAVLFAGGSPSSPTSIPTLIVSMSPQRLAPSRRVHARSFPFILRCASLT